MPTSSTDQPDAATLRRKLLRWYRNHGRDLPWRNGRSAGPRPAPDPYRVWLSEIMLQQTTVATVTGYYDDFVARWPTIEALAAADLDQVLHAWQGLGYYSRARNLHRCAGVVTSEFRGRFPADEAALRKLPGIGPYTAAAIAAIAFGHKTMPVDGNIERVMARLHAIGSAAPAAKAEIAALARMLIPARGPGAGDIAQAMMDLGATVCTPRGLACDACPWRRECRARASGRPEAFPAKRAKPPRPQRYGVLFWLERSDGAVLLRRRPERGLLGGMMEFPSTEWREAKWTASEARPHAPASITWRPLAGHVDHVFTHFALWLEIWRGRLGVEVAQPTGTWTPVAAFGDRALPTLMKKVVRHLETSD